MKKSNYSTPSITITYFESITSNMEGFAPSNVGINLVGITGEEDYSKINRLRVKTK